MTRWARSSSVQRHKKVPGFATPWSDFKGQFSKKANNPPSPSSSVCNNGTVGKKPTLGKRKRQEEHSALDGKALRLVDNVLENYTAVSPSKQGGGKKMLESWSLSSISKLPEKKRSVPNKFIVSPIIDKPKLKDGQLDNTFPNEKTNNAKELYVTTKTPLNPLKKELETDYQPIVEGEIQNEQELQNAQISLNFENKFCKNLIKRISSRKCIQSGFIVLPQRVEKEIDELKKSLLRQKMPKKQIKGAMMRRRRHEEKLFCQRRLHQGLVSETGQLKDEDVFGSSSSFNPISPPTEVLARVRKVEELLYGKKLAKKEITAAVCNMRKL